MSTVTPIQPAAPTFTQAHRDAIAHIQDLAITLTLQGSLSVSLDFLSAGPSLSVHIRRVSEITRNNHKADARFNIDLPDQVNAWQGHNALPQLQALARTLEDLLPPPTGGNAA